MEEPFMRGRRPAGPEYIERLEGSALAKVRAKVVLQTMARELTVAQACAQLGICEQRFYQLREEHLSDFVAGFEPGQPGRPPRTPSLAEQQIRDLQEQLAAKDVALRTALAREEIALCHASCRTPRRKKKRHTARRRTGRRAGRLGRGRLREPPRRTRLSPTTATRHRAVTSLGTPTAPA
jgi:hypothetical protein